MWNVAYYAKLKFVEGIVATGLHLLSKLRGDADLRWLSGDLQERCGHKRQYLRLGVTIV